VSQPRLWSWALSPFAGKARVALAYRGIDVELVEIDPRHRPLRLRTLNPSNRVPVLEVGDVAIRESTAICEWAQDCGAGPSLWPEDPAERARARGLLRWVDDELTESFFQSMRKEAFGLDPGDPPDLVAQLRARLARRWATLEDLLARSRGHWLAAGPRPTMADLAAIPLSVRLPAWRPDLMPDAARYPLATAWMATLSGLPVAEQVDRRGAAAPGAR
jgi:glutathione S-transferase